MTPTLLAPIALVALAALAVPILIHIARRTEATTVVFAALRWLDPRPRPRKSLTVDERLLLAVRLILLAAIVSCLARPAILGASDDRPVVAVVPGVDAEAAARFIADDARAVWLSAGFPRYDGSAPPYPSNPSSLLRELDAQTGEQATLTVVTPPLLTGVDAERPRLSRAVRWFQAAGTASAEANTTSPSAPAFAIRHAQDRAAETRWFRAAAMAWGSSDRLEPPPDTAVVDSPLRPETRSLVWIATGPVPEAIMDWVRAGGVLLVSVDAEVNGTGENRVVWRDAAGAPLATEMPLERGRVIRLTRPLEPAFLPQLVDPDFPDDLFRMLDPPPPPSRAAAADLEPVRGSITSERSPLEVTPWLALLAALIFGLERWLATRAGRDITA